MCGDFRSRRLYPDIQVWWSLMYLFPRNLSIPSLPLKRWSSQHLMQLSLHYSSARCEKYSTGGIMVYCCFLSVGSSVAVLGTAAASSNKQGWALPCWAAPEGFQTSLVFPLPILLSNRSSSGLLCPCSKLSPQPRLALLSFTAQVLLVLEMCDQNRSQCYRSASTAGSQGNGLFIYAGKITFLRNISRSPSLQMYNEGYFSLLGATVHC